MILADTSIWIDAIRYPEVRAKMSRKLGELVMCGPVLQEVLQGLADKNTLVQGTYTGELREAILSIPRIGDPMGIEIFLRASSIFAEGRRRGYSIRSAMDCLIAATALENGATVWHRDRDFSTIARFTPLRVVMELAN